MGKTCIHHLRMPAEIDDVAIADRIKLVEQLHYASLAISFIGLGWHGARMEQPQLQVRMARGGIAKLASKQLLDGRSRTEPKNDLHAAISQS